MVTANCLWCGRKLRILETWTSHDHAPVCDDCLVELVNNYGPSHGPEREAFLQAALKSSLTS